jgi:hypothetical protein
MSGGVGVDKEERPEPLRREKKTSKKEQGMQQKEGDPKLT